MMESASCVFNMSVLLQDQVDAIWKIKDALNSDLNNALLKEMLLANKQNAPSSAAKVNFYKYSKYFT